MNHSTEDVSKELHRVMGLDDSTDTSDEDEPFQRPPAPTAVNNMHIPQASVTDGRTRPITRGNNKAVFGSGTGSNGTPSQFHPPSTDSGSQKPPSTVVIPTSGGGKVGGGRESSQQR